MPRAEPNRWAHGSATFATSSGDISWTTLNRQSALSVLRDLLDERRAFDRPGVRNCRAARHIVGCRRSATTGGPRQPRRLTAK
jgi:hypothetical protein